MHIHPQPSIRADTCTHTLSSRHRPPNADTQSALDTCWNMQTTSARDPSHRMHTQTHLLIREGTCRRCTLRSRHRKLNEDARSALDTCQQTLSSRGTCRRHTLSSRHMKLDQDTRSAPDTCRQHTLSSRGTRRWHTLSRHMQKYSKLGIRAYACRLQYLHVHSSNANRNEIQLSLMLHMAMTQICWYSDLQKHVPS
jgi:hypothetical protein